ncbi:MAG TPA: 3-hydroxyacyl-CoA dehydrogenase NAD-binding domain-containing protein [Vicinamibacterales bacterium]|nr:3-hydroxyacyl-CoA dehydrogenase NAD-binding domain-containing protein [Vicinamibacterales bacterium]
MINSVAVLGAGVMGAQIAAHFANAGVPSLLLDVTSDAAEQGLKRARGLKPDPFFTPETHKLISTASFDEGLARLKDADWILEAVVEKLDVKRELLARVDAARRAASIVSSNTSAISIAAIGEGRSDDFRRHWLGTHFFNPPRYLHLLEVIPTPETDPAVLEKVTAFADRSLGKGVVVAKDSPGFIGNHLALYGVARMLAALESGAYTIEEIDEITGPAIGRPKSATFRTLDLAGLDILAHVIRDLNQRLPDADARATFAVPAFVERMLDKGLVGEKAGQGFYKRVKGSGGESEILTLDRATLDYVPRQSPRLPALESARTINDIGERIKTLFNGNDRVGQFLRETLAPTLVYAAQATPAVAHSPDDVDRVMRWGFGWDLGPFEIADAIGVDRVIEVARQVNPELLERGVPEIGEQRTTAPSSELQILKNAKDQSRIVQKNAGASLVDIGDGVLAIEFHSKMNAIGADTLQMLQAGVREAERNFAALVVGNDAPHFSAGANLMLLLLEAQEENWDDIDLIIRQFQQSTMGLRYSKVPVIVAPAGLALGGGCEVCLHGDRVQAAGETYMGLVEVGVGLIPAGAGTKEMVARAAEQMPPGSNDFLPTVQRAFELIGFAKTSASGPDAQRLGYLRPVDAITMNRDRLMTDAKARALQRVRDGYRPPSPRMAIPVGGSTVAAALKLGVHLAWRGGRISDHDALIGRKLATIMAGGDVPHPTTVTEQRLLDLEREAFLSLVAERKTQERIQYTLKTGKPLRN